jgi:hypothetical protein
MPGVFKGGDLCVGILAFGGFKQQVVIAFAVERGVQINQVHGGIWNVLSENIKVVAKVK